MVENNSVAHAISSLTGLPKDQIVDTRNPTGDPVVKAIASLGISPNDIKINSSKDTSGYDPLQKSAFTIDLTNVYTDPLASYTKYGVPLNPFVDWNEERAQRQSTGKKWVNGLTKAGITTLGALYENTVGVVAGLGSLAMGDSYYDNFVGRQVDEMNEWSQKNLPNYYTKAEQNASVLESLGTANFWADKFANGLGYTVGSIATMFLGVGELGLASKLGSLAAKGAKGAKILDAGLDVANLADDAAKAVGSSQKALYTTVKGIEEAKAVGKGLERLDKVARIQTATKHLAVGTQMSLAEASVEAREAKKQFMESEIAKWQEAHPGEPVPSDVEAAIEASATAAGNVTFGINLPLLTATNLLMFGKTLMGSRLGEKAMFDVERKTVTDAATAGSKWAEKTANSKMGRLYAKAQKNFGPVLENMATEGFQEGAQFAASEFSRNYYSDKFSDGSADMAKAFSEALSHTLGSKEGWENIVIGALVGGGTGAVSRIAGAEKRLLKAKNTNTQEALKILNSGGVSNAIENMEQTTHNLALVKQMDDANKKGDFEAAETARMRIIHNVFSKLNRLGALDYAMEQFEDAASMSEDDFKKAFGYDMKATLKEQTGKTQSEIIADTKSKMETAIKRSEQVSRILSQYEPGNNLIAKIKEGLQTDETKNNKKIQESVRNLYGQMLTYHLLDIDSIDSVIVNQYDKLVQLAPALASIPKEDLLYRLKIGEVAIDENGEIKVSSKSNAVVDTKFKAAIEDVFKGFSVLDDGNNAEEFVNNLSKLNGLMVRRGRLVESFKNLKRNPEQMDLVVEAEMLKRDFEERKASNDRTKQAIQGAETSEDLEIDEDTDDELKIQAEKRREELRAIEDAKQLELKKLSDDELMAMDISELEISDPQAAVALSREIAERAMVKAEEAFAEKQKEEEPTDESPLTDAERNALNEITMDSLSKNEFIIDGQVYYVPETDLEALIEWQWIPGQEEPEAKSVTLFNVQTNQPFTWKIQNIVDTTGSLDGITNENGDVDYNKAAQATQDLTATLSLNASIEKETATALAIINVLLTEAASIRAAEEADYRTLEESKQTAMEDGRMAIDSTLETLQKDTNFKNELKQTGLDKNADPYEAGGVTSEQLKYQIEELKEHLKQLDATIAKERQIAIEEGVSEKEFKKIRAAELLKTREKAFQLLKEKQKALMTRTSEQSEREGNGPVNSLPVAPNDAEYGYIIEKASQEISNYENQISELERTVTELDKIINGEYGDQNIDDAKAKKRKAISAITYRRKKIQEKQQIINTANGTRELENRTKDGDTAAGTSPAPEGEGVEGTDIDPATRSTTEGLDGSISTEEAERIKQQKADAIEAAKKMGVQGPEEKGPRPTSQGVPSTTVVTDGSNLDVQTVKGSEEIVNGKVLVDEDGSTRQDYTSMVQQTIDGEEEEILVFPALLTNPSIAPVGSEIKFEMRADTDWVKTQIPEGKDVNQWLVEGGWKIVPIFMVYNGERLALLKAFDETSPEGFKGAKRQDIVNVILKGGKATAEVTGKLVDTKSISNAVTSTGETFFYPFTTIKENDKPTSIVYVGIDITNNRRWDVAYVGEGVDPVDATTSSTDLTKLTPGQIGIVTTNPEGAPIIIMASTRNVGEREAAIAIGHITKENPEASKYSEIVGTSIVPVQSTDGDIEVESSDIKAELGNLPTSGHTDSYSKFIMTYSLEDGKQMFVFYSESAEGLIRIDEENLKIALLGGRPNFSFVQDTVNDRGLVTFKSASMPMEKRAVVEKALGEDFKAVTLKKKMQVDKNVLQLNIESYESPLTGNVYRAEEGLPHPYIQYLSSESEFEGSPRTEGKGSNAILTVDTKVNSQGSVFYDVNLRLGPLKAEGVDMATQDDLDSKSVSDTIDSLTFTPATQPQAPVSDKKADIERRSGESSTDFINRLFKNNYFVEVDGKQLFSLAGGRWGVIVNVNGITIPFYQSTSGTDTKITGQWYPFFGDLGNWVIKGNSDDSNLGYGFKAIQDVQSFLNSNIKETDALALSDIVHTEINQNKEDFRKLNESQIKSNNNLSISKKATAKRLSELMGYTVEEANKTKSDAELFALASKKVFAELAALQGKPAILSEDQLLNKVGDIITETSKFKYKTVNLKGTIKNIEKTENGYNVTLSFKTYNGSRTLNVIIENGKVIKSISNNPLKVGDFLENTSSTYDFNFSAPTSTPTVTQPTTPPSTVIATSENAIEAPQTPAGFFRKPGQKIEEKPVSSSSISGFNDLVAMGFSQDIPQEYLDGVGSNSIPDDVISNAENKGKDKENEC